MFGLGRPKRPKMVAFDVIGTLFSLDRLRAAVRALGAPAVGLELWFAQSLRDFFAFSHAGGYVPLRDVLEAALPRAMRVFDVEVDADRAATAMGAMAEMDPADGAVQACETLADAGCRLVALSNGSVEATQGLLERAGLRERFAAVRSCDEVRTSKPAPAVYDLVESVAGGERWMVAAHAWDVAGAQRAGLRGAWVSAVEGRHLTAYPSPDLRAGDLSEAARRVLELRLPAAPSE